MSIEAKVDTFLSQPKQLLIDGKWVAALSGKTFDTIDPATERVLTQVARSGRDDVELAVKAARKAFESGPWPKMMPAERARLLWRIADLIEANADELARLESLDNGKPATYARVVDVAWAINFLRYMAGWATKVE